MKIKFFIFSTVWVLVSIFISGCIVIELNGCSGQSVRGSGNVISESRHVPEFRELRLEGRGKVSLTQGNRSSVEVTTDDNILPSIDTEVTNGKLIISHEKGKDLRPTTLYFAITVKDLEGISIAGSGDIIGNEVFNSEKLYTDIAGSGDIDIRVSADRLESSISGSGSISLSGSANSYDARITGSGNIDAFDLQTTESSVVITGSGNLRIRVSDRLRAKITGSGDVLYKGDPRISQSITGSGKVKDRN